VRVALYAALLGFALPIVYTAFGFDWLEYIPMIHNCTLGNQMAGALFISAPSTAIVYGAVMWIAVFLVKEFSKEPDPSVSEASLD
jgi:hypothetical protein